MSQQSIVSNDLTIGQVFQYFYNVPDYQREYVWGDSGSGEDKGDEVIQFLRDIQQEFDQRTKDGAPEYFIGTIVVCPTTGDEFDLIDGQQRTTTAFITLCAIRDRLAALGADVPEMLTNQIASGSIDFTGKVNRRMRLQLQYEDAGDILALYGSGQVPTVVPDQTRSIRNIGSAYETVKEFLVTSFRDDASSMFAFYGYFVTKVKLIRIETSDVSRALKIFETINQRGVGLNPMDLLKNLLFMHAHQNDFAKLKQSWQSLTDTLYTAGEKPLRFLRYFLMATYAVDTKLREEDIYDWFGTNKNQTGHEKDPIGFVKQLLDAASAYANFMKARNPQGEEELGIWNTRALGGWAIRQHFILLLAGRHLDPTLFSRLADNVEQMMFVWLIAGVSAKDYERSIAQAARDLRSVTDKAGFDSFETSVFVAAKARHRKAFHDALTEMVTWNIQKYRMKYLLAKLSQHVDIDAYGPEGRTGLAQYLESANDVEHILPRNPSAAAAEEFGDSFDDEDYIEALGNLLWLERAINRSIGNAAYSVKAAVYPNSSFLLSRCQAVPMVVGKNDSITRAIGRLDPAPTWNWQAIEQRQAWMADRALAIWNVPQAV